MTIPVLAQDATSSITILENEFIDKHMAQANGEFVKVYLLILRQKNRKDVPLNIAQMADFLNCTEGDIIRACNYWKKIGLLTYKEVGKTIVQKEKKKPSSTSFSLEQKEQEWKQLVYVAEQYLGRTLTATDMDTLLFFLDTLEFSIDLIEYLLEYCVEHNHTSIHYIKKVALSWKEKEIQTPTQAKEAVSTYTKDTFSILKAFGIQNRGPAPFEQELIKTWKEQYGFSLDLMLEACHRTVKATHQPSFEYADTILSNWKKQGLWTLKDVKKADLAYQQEKEQQKKNSVPKKSRAVSSAKFHQFDHRTYDMTEMERQLIQGEHL